MTLRQMDTGRKCFECSNKNIWKWLQWQWMVCKVQRADWAWSEEIQWLHCAGSRLTNVLFLSTRDCSHETQPSPPPGFPGPPLLRARPLPACGEHEGPEVSPGRGGGVHHAGLVQLLQSLQVSWQCRREVFQEKFSGENPGWTPSAKSWPALEVNKEKKEGGMIGSVSWTDIFKHSNIKN